MPTKTKRQQIKTPRRRTQRERSETTTRKLLSTARKHFARIGYAGTSVDSIVASCRVTKGAFYHHFSTKEQLFEAVFIEEQARIVVELTETYRAKAERDPLQAFYEACRAYLAISLDPAVQRITLLDALAVLGWERMREIESDYGLAMMKMAIGNALAAGGSRRRQVDPLAHILFGAMSEAAMYLAYAEDQVAAKRQVERELKRVLDCLLGS